MKHLNIVAATLAAACLGTFANAELTDVTVELIDNGMDGITTAQIHAQFDDPNDLILGVFGGTGHPMNLQAPGGLWNDDTGTGIPLDDTPGVGGQYDTWVGFVGDLAAPTVLFTTDFWGVTGGGSTTSVLQDGTTHLWSSNTCYCMNPDMTDNEIDSGNRITIAQFSFHGTWARMTGSIVYVGGPSFQFDALLPAPGAFALLGIAMISSPRQRQRSS